MNLYEKNIYDYSKCYLKEYNKKISFEAILVDVRRRIVLKSMNKYAHKYILEIGCGLEPLFKYYDKFKSYTIVEPSNIFCQHAKKIAKGKRNIKIIKGYFEEVYMKLLKAESSGFDFIILSSLLHEVPNPRKLLKIIYRLCKNDTVVHINVPNVYSFHRLLAYEMGLIGSIFEKSETGIKLQRQTNFDKKLLFKMLQETDFKVISHGTYFIKPFNNRQMAQIIEKNIAHKDIIRGLERMIKYMPDLGCEMFVDVKINPLALRKI